MKRRTFLAQAGAGLAATATAAPAFAQAAPQVKWRLASSFPKSLDTIYGAGAFFCERVGKLTAGKFEITPYAAGQIVPPLQVLDAVQQGTVECGHTASYYYVAKNRAFAFGCAIPFGLTSRQQSAWEYAGGGLELLRDFYKEYGIVHFPAGNTGTQMGGWFKKEITTVADLKGLKMRIPGIGGEVMGRLGAAPQALPGNEIYAALERGVIEYCATLGIRAECRKNAPGVYVDGRKIASVGLRIRRGASYHGLAFNVNMDLEPFQRINPCGYAGLQMTQLAALGQPDASVETVGRAFIPFLQDALTKLRTKAPV